MAAPTVEVTQRSIGRFGEFAAKVVWTQAEPDDLDAAILLNLDVVSGKYRNPRFALLEIQWNSALILAADLEFDSVPWTTDNRILAIPTDASQGRMVWSAYLDGKKNEPNPDAPGNVVLTTHGAVPGDELYLTGRYMEKGEPV